VNEPPAQLQLRIQAPEGLTLGFRLAEVGDRANAFLLDLLFIALSIAVVMIGWALIGSDAYLESVALLAFFLIWNFYFTFFEIRWQGQTPGKRILRLRAVDARGGALSVEAIFARNVTRDLEMVFPSILLLNPQALFPGSPSWVQALASLWLVALLLFPAFNVNHMRIGDLVGGTVVVALPKRQLLQDLADRKTGTTLVFTQEQLDVYGIFELQKLEEILRGSSRHGGEETLRAVADAIRNRIKWHGPAVDDLAFLRAFYAAQRPRLEQRLVLGDRRERKR
jgi:uncharacterized RDD family membrane protein YckC